MVCAWVRRGAVERAGRYKGKNPPRSNQLSAIIRQLATGDKVQICDLLHSPQFNDANRPQAGRQFC
eukprot:COSAG01_NODE_227_length_21107_cov_85.615099_6_plen_66_part_00